MSDDWKIGRLRGNLAIVFWRDGKRHRHALGTSDPVEAARRAPSVYEHVTRPKGNTVEALWRAYCADKAGRAIVTTMKHTWKPLRARFGPMHGSDITIADCRAYVAERRAMISARTRKPIKDGSICTELGHLRMVLVWAVKHKLLREAPTIERPSLPLPKEGHLTRREARRLIEGAEMPHLKLFTILALTTGARVAAILDLTWDRCDFDLGRVNLRNPEIGRPHKGRAIVPMNRTLRTALLEARNHAITEHVIEWGGERVGSVKKGLAAAARRANLKHVSPHMLRHSAAVHMAEDGRPMEEIAQFLGHSDVKVTRQVYARFSPDYLAEAAAALEYDDLGSSGTRRTSFRSGKKLEKSANTRADVVGATGIEPVTPSMSRLRSQRKTAT